MIWELLGKALAVYILGNVICFIWSLLRMSVFPMLGWRTNLRSYGEWAVVTGATDGIGKGYARQLAKKGFKLVLISRTQEKLDNVKTEISEAFKVEVKTIAFDYSSVSGYEEIEKVLKNLNIAILVNNVGVGNTYPEYFGSIPVDESEKMMNVNILSVIKMSHMVLPGMLERKKGIIIHVASASAIRPFPLITVYSATKAFVDFFARGLHEEYKDQGIISQSILPNFVATNMSRMKPSLFVPDPDSYARDALNTVGISTRSDGFWGHKLTGLLFSLIPPGLFSKLSMDALKKFRANYLKKKSKTQ